ncbi:MAG: hypothetical protein HY683_03595 [Chloroflexi bacterium]|nr:hypothetical protein [Chloroflexota bacterium]
MALLLVAAALVVGTPQGRVGAKTLLFLPQVLPQVKVKPLGWFSPTPQVSEVRFPTADGNGVADLYRPGGEGKHGAVLLFLGVNPAGRDDPRVVDLATGLARSGIVVLVPWSDTMTQSRIDPREVGRLVSAFQYLRSLPYVDGRRAGMGGFCVGASLALVAAADPRISDDVAFVNSFGGYFDARDLVSQIASRHAFYNGQVEPWQPGELARQVFTAQLIEGLPAASDRDLLQRSLDNGALTDAQRASLTPSGLAALRLLEGVPPEEASDYVASLPPDLLRSLGDISPSQHLATLKAEVLVMHDRQDDAVPAGESRRLAEALGPRGRVFHTEFSFFQHVDPTRPVPPLTFMREAFKLSRHMYRILRVATA